MKTLEQMIISANRAVEFLKAEPHRHTRECLLGLMQTFECLACNLHPNFTLPEDTGEGLKDLD